MMIRSSANKHRPFLKRFYSIQAAAAMVPEIEAQLKDTIREQFRHLSQQAQADRHNQADNARDEAHDPDENRAIPVEPGPDRVRAGRVKKNTHIQKAITADVVVGVLGVADDKHQHTIIKTAGETWACVSLGIWIGDWVHAGTRKLKVGDICHGVIRLRHSHRHDAGKVLCQVHISIRPETNNERNHEDIALHSHPARNNCPTCATPAPWMGSYTYLTTVASTLCTPCTSVRYCIKRSHITPRRHSD